MENCSEGRFSYSVISCYLQNGLYPDSFSKADKSALRKRAKYFMVLNGDTNLYYIGGGRHVILIVHKFSIQSAVNDIINLVKPLNSVIIT